MFFWGIGTTVFHRIYARDSGLRSENSFAPIARCGRAGKTLIITRHGRAIARIVPEVGWQQASIDGAMEAYSESATEGGCGYRG